MPLLAEHRQPAAGTQFLDSAAQLAGQHESAAHVHACSAAVLWI